MQRGLLAGNSFLKHLRGIFHVHGFQGTLAECNHRSGLFVNLPDMSFGHDKY